MFLTREGARKLEAELDDLERVRRPEIAERLRAAREFGVGLENTELLEAKEDMQRLEDQICDVRALLFRSGVIQPSRRPRGEVGVGSRVVVESETGEEEFMIVGSVEADLCPKGSRSSRPWEAP